MISAEVIGLLPLPGDPGVWSRIERIRPGDPGAWSRIARIRPGDPGADDALTLLRTVVGCDARRALSPRARLTLLLTTFIPVPPFGPAPIVGDPSPPPSPPTG
jgi:hypothetical protein